MPRFAFRNRSTSNNTFSVSFRNHANTESTIGLGLKSIQDHLVVASFPRHAENDHRPLDAERSLRIRLGDVVLGVNDIDFPPEMHVELALQHIRQAGMTGSQRVLHFYRPENKDK